MVGKDINKAKEVLMDNGLVAIPTETVYGLSANALQSEAVVKIFEAKQRPAFDPLIVHVANQDQAKNLTLNWPKEAQLLADAFWPGPMTLILPKSDLIPDLVTSGHPTVGVRIPNHALTLQLLSSLDFPVAAPSANPFGYVSPTLAQHVENQLGNKVDYILDGGAAEVGVESTIVKVENGKVFVLRLGGLSIEEIETCLGKPVDQIKTSSSNPEAPGMLSSHYNPGKKIIIGNITDLLADSKAKNIGVLSFKDEFQSKQIAKQVVLSPTGDLVEAAQNLFAALRSFDEEGIEVVYTEFVPDEGLGRAINDRIKRAGVAL